MRIGNFEITRKKKNEEKIYDNSQIRAGAFDYSGTFASNYSQGQDVNVYKFMRNQLSFLDAAVLKRVLLIGDFQIYAEDESTTEFLNDYKKNIKENYFGRGWTNFMHQHADSVFATGIGLSERIPGESMGGARALCNADPSILRFIPDKESGYVLGYQAAGMVAPKPFENQDLIYYTAFDKRYGNPKGYSLFHSLEFATQLMTRIFQALHNNVWRIGDPTFISVVKGSAARGSDLAAKNVSGNVQTQFKQVAQNRSRGRVGDMHYYMPAEFDFEIKALGVDGIPAFDYLINSRVAIEQLITKTHLPPYAFGFYQWNSNYRMSTDQQRMLLAAVQKDRMALEPIIYRDFGMELFYAGKRKKFWIEWDEIDLTEISETARANHLNAAANKANSETQLNLWLNGVISDDELRSALEFYDLLKDKQDSQKILDNLDNYRKLVLLERISRNTLSEKVNDIN